MSEINVQLKDGTAAQLPGPVTVADVLKQLDRDAAKQALAARVNGHLFKFLAFLVAVIESHPQTKTATSHVWFKSNGAIDLQFTMIKTSATVFTFPGEGS